MRHRPFLHVSAAIAGALAIACLRSGQQAIAKTGDAPRTTLLVYFSRAGENYFKGARTTLAVGNTAIVAAMIRDALDCDVLNARPRIANLPTSTATYDTILIGSPIWNVRVPRIMLTFAEHFEFAGKTVHPFTTYAMSGLGHAVEEYAAACRGATIGEALAVHGEEAVGSRGAVDAWLRRIGARRTQLGRSR